MGQHLLAISVYEEASGGKELDTDIAKYINLTSPRRIHLTE